MRSGVGDVLVLQHRCDRQESAYTPTIMRSQETANLLLHQFSNLAKKSDITSWSMDALEMLPRHLHDRVKLMGGLPRGYNRQVICPASAWITTRPTSQEMS